MTKDRNLQTEHKGASNMTAQKARKPEVGKSADKNPNVQSGQHAAKETKAKKRAQLIMSPECAAYRVILCADGNTDLHQNTDAQSTVDELRAQTAAINRGDIGHVEAMLMNQATALQTLFAGLTERAMSQKIIPNLERTMRMALRAQNQCRATLQTLAMIKNPPVVIARQANINQGSGNQQVNNGVPPEPGHAAPAATHTEISIIHPNELSEVKHGSEKMDIRIASKAGRNNKAMATME